MLPFARVAVAAIAVVAAVGGAVYIFAPASQNGSGGVPNPTSTASPVPASAKPATSPSPSPLDTATWTTYVSDRYGFSIGRPAAWTESAADHDWTLPTDADWLNTAWERFIAPDQTIFLAAWSAPVEPGTSVNAWLQANCPQYDIPCTGIQDRAVVVTLDGHPGILVPFTDDVQVFTLVNDRMYVLASGRPEGQYDSLRLVEAFLSTMHLLPGGPVPATSSAPPAASPGPS